MIQLLFLLSYVFLVVLGIIGFMLLIQLFFYQVLNINLYKIIKHLIEIEVNK